MSDEDAKIIQVHRDRMTSNLRMAAEAERINAYESADRFLAIAAQHAAIATELRAIAEKAEK